jgi:hypothetical protein
MVFDGTACSSADHGMLAGHVPGYSADRCTFEATLGRGDHWNGSGRSCENDRQQGVAH